MADKIRVRGLSVYYGELQALRRVTTSIADRAVTALIGPSGCGKTTFLRSLNRLIDLIPNTRVEGQIFLDDVDVYSPGVDVVDLRRRVGMVFQTPNPFPKSIFDNVAYGPRIHGLSNQRRLEEVVEQSLRRAALWDEVKDKLRHSALDLSGGQQQRLVIARALAVEPDVLLMDEPTSALDPISAGRIEELITELKAEYPIVIVTHNMQQAARIADWTGFFLHGELVEFAETERLFTAPKEPRTEAYLTGRYG